MLRRLSLLFTLCTLLCLTLSTVTFAQPTVRQPDTVFREWDVATFAIDPTASQVFYYVDQADSAVRAYSTVAAQRLPYSWSYTDRLHSLAIDYRSRVCVLLQSNSTYYIQQLNEQLNPTKTLKIDSSPTTLAADTAPLRLLTDFTNQLWIAFSTSSSIDVYAIDSTSGTRRTHFKLDVASASQYVWTLDDSLNLWLQQSDRAQQTYSYSSTGTSLATLQLNHTTAWIHSMAVAANGALTFAYSNDETLVTFDVDGRRLPRADWVSAFEDDALTDLTWDEDGHLLARAVSAESVLTISADGSELLRAWQSSVVSFARVHSMQYDEFSGDLFTYGATEEQGYSSLYRVTASDGSLLQQYRLPARLSECVVQQVELSNHGNLWHLLVCTATVNGSTRRWQELYVTDRSGRLKRQLRLDDKPYFTIYHQRFLVDDDQQLIYIPYYNSSSKVSVLNVYAFNLTLVNSLPTPFSLTSVLVVEMSLNTGNSTVYWLTTTANWINCTLYALSLTAPPTPTPLFTIAVAALTNQRAQYHLTYTRDDWRAARVLISVHTFAGESGVYEYDERQQLVEQYGWDGGAVDNIVAGSDGRLYGFVAQKRRIVSWRMGGRVSEQRLQPAHLDITEAEQAVVSVVA